MNAGHLSNARRICRPVMETGGVPQIACGAGVRPPACEERSRSLGRRFPAFRVDGVQEGQGQGIVGAEDDVVLAVLEDVQLGRCSA